MPQQDLTHRRLGGFYFFYFAYLGAYTPFFTLYLLWVGRSAVEIGVLMALPAVARIVAPHLWGWLAEVAGRQTPLLRATTRRASSVSSACLRATAFTGCSRSCCS
jgi:PPP family 3-phenylpropionic acid transporter